MPPRCRAFSPVFSPRELPSQWMPPLPRLSMLLLLGVAGVFSQTPMVSPGGVVDAATFGAPVSPGSLVSIFGTNLAPQTTAASAIPLPQSLAGVSVQIDNIAAPLLYVSANQINAQIPWEVAASGSVSVIVTNNGVQSAPVDVAIGSYSPGVFASAGYAIAILSDGSLA